MEDVELVNAETLEPLNRIEGKVLAAIAARLGKARLIDNILINIPKKSSAASR